MPDDATPPPPVPTSATTTPTPSEPSIPFHIGEEFGTAKKNLPSIKIVLICVAVIAAIAAIFAFVQRPQSATTGSMDNVISAEVPNQNIIIVAINVTVKNNGEKPYWIHTIKADLDASSGSFSDDAASAGDFDRYFQAFPALKEHALPPLAREARINPGAQLAGTILVTFPVAPDAFASRKSLKVTIQPYDQPVPLILTK